MHRLRAGADPEAALIAGGLLTAAVVLVGTLATTHLLLVALT